LPGFCQLIDQEAMVSTASLSHSADVTPGRFYLGNGEQQLAVKFSTQTGILRVEAAPTKPIPWHEGIQLWLSQLGEQVQQELTVYFLSAAHVLPLEIIHNLLGAKTRLLLAPRNMLLCPELVDSIEAYAEHYPQQIILASHDNLLECWVTK
jgi:hypothetical protein